MTSRFLEVAGTHLEIGRGIGEHFRDSIRQSLDRVAQEIAARTPVDSARLAATAYVPEIKGVAPHLIDEIDGVAQGAGIDFADALILQLRFDLVGFDMDHGCNGCSSFAIADAGVRLSGQNVDAPPWHKDSGCVVAIHPPNGPSLLMYTYYPGMIGYVGINSAGLSVFGNALLSAGWRVGVPRYLLVRLALEQTTVEHAHKALREIHRGSSINLLLTDSGGSIVDLEVDVDDIGVVTPTRSRLFHTNHYVTKSLCGRDRSADILPDSVPRLNTGTRLLQNVRADSGKASAVAQIAALLSDHSDGPASICRHAAADIERPADGWESVASIVADPDDGVMHVSFDNPCRQRYRAFSLFASRGAGAGGIASAGG